MKQPTLSIITLTKNRADLLDANLASLRGQLTGHDEIIIVDNNSTDHTDRVLRRHKHTLPIRVIHRRHGSYPELYNTGLRYAKNDIVVFFDDDCIADPAFLSRIRKVHAHASKIAIQGMTYSIPKGNIYADIMGDHYQAFLQSNMRNNGTLRILDNKNASIRRDVVRSLGGFSNTMKRGSEDIELGIRIQRRGIPIYLDRAIVAYHHERTTFVGFIAQHLRFAASEGYLDRTLPPQERVRLVRWSKVSLQLLAMLRREAFYLRHGKIDYALLTPMLFILLALIRIWGYARHRWNPK